MRIGYDISFTKNIINICIIIVLFIRNRMYAKLLVVQNVTQTPVPCVNTLRRFTELIFTLTNDTKEMVIMAAEEEVVAEVVEVETVQVLMMPRHTEAMKCR